MYRNGMCPVNAAPCVSVILTMREMSVKLTPI
eukprot:COSAG02_NODE_54643_length_295_cov_0.540816_1_plen_31_part_01